MAPTTVGRIETSFMFVSPIVQIKRPFPVKWTVIDPLGVRLCEGAVNLMLVGNTFYAIEKRTKAEPVKAEGTVSDCLLEWNRESFPELPVTSHLRPFPRQFKGVLVGPGNEITLEFQNPVLKIEWS